MSKTRPHWQGQRQHRWSRRGVLRGAVLTGSGFVGTALLACSSKRKPALGPSTGASAPAETPRPGGVANVLGSAEVPGLDPHGPSGGSNSQTLLLSGPMSLLWHFKTGPTPDVAANQELENDLALSSESPDATTWTVKLRPGAVFQDTAPVNGHPVEAEDIQATFVRALGMPQNPNRGSLGMIDAGQIETPARDTVVFKLKYPFSLFPKLLAAQRYSWILPREALAGAYDPAKQVIGSGPFLLDSFTPDVAFVFKKNPRWFEKGRPYLDGVRAAVIPTDTQQLAQFLSGNLDEFRVRYKNLDTVQKGVANAQIFKYFTTSGGYPLSVQLGDPSSPFRDIRLRRAFSMALDRDAIGKVIYDGQDELAFFVPLGFGKWALRENEVDSSILPYYKFDLEQAKKLLAEAGGSNLAVKLAYVGGGGPSAGGLEYTTTVGMYNSMLNAAGLRSSQVQIDYVKDFIAGGKGSLYGYFPPDMVVIGGVSNSSSVDENLFNYFHSKGRYTPEHLQDSALDGMIDKARTIVKADDQVKAYKDVQKYIAQQMFVVSGLPLGYTFTAVQSRLANYGLSLSAGNLTETYSKVWLRQ